MISAVGTDQQEKSLFASFSSEKEDSFSPVFSHPQTITGARCEFVLF
jgi:hypothetical protein